METKALYLYVVLSYHIGIMGEYLFYFMCHSFILEQYCSAKNKSIFDWDSGKI